MSYIKRFMHTFDCMKYLMVTLTEKSDIVIKLDWMALPI